MSAEFTGKTIAVTGGAGFIGSNLTRRLLKNGNKVVVVDNLSYGKIENLDFVKKEGYEATYSFKKVDIRDYENLVDALKGVEYVFHMAALGSVPASIDDPQLACDINISGSLNVLRAAKENKIRRVVVSSSSAVYGDNPTLPKLEDMRPEPESPYATSKISMEYLGKNYTDHFGVETAILRYFNVFGPHQDPSSQYAAVIPIFISKLLRKESPVIFGDGNQTRDFIHVDDVVEANIRAASAPVSACGQAINVAGGRRISVNLLFEKIASLLNSRIKPTYMPERQGDVKHSVASVEKAKQFLDFDNSVSVEEGLEKSIEWYKANLS